MNKHKELKNLVVICTLLVLSLITAYHTESNCLRLLMLLGVTILIFMGSYTFFEK